MRSIFNISAMCSANSYVSSSNFLKNPSKLVSVDFFYMHNFANLHLLCEVNFWWLHAVVIESHDNLPIKRYGTRSYQTLRPIIVSRSVLENEISPQRQWAPIPDVEWTGLALWASVSKWTFIASRQLQSNGSVHSSHFIISIWSWNPCFAPLPLSTP